MYVNGKIFMSLSQTVDDPIQYPQKILEHKEKTAIIARKLGKIWLVILPFAVSTGVIAGAILFYAFTSGLYRHYTGG